jgi:hypothetical protein
MNQQQRAALVRRNRPRGHYIPNSEAQALITLCGWHLLDDCPAGVNGIVHDECLLLPPQSEEQAA